MLHELAQSKLKYYGGYSTYEVLDQNYIDKWRGRLPDSFLTLWQELGLGSTSQGSLQFCRPEDYSDILVLLFGADKDFHHRDCHVIAYSAFGKLYVWSERLNAVIINVVNLEFSCPDLDSPNRVVLPERAVWSMITNGFDNLLFDYWDTKGKQLYKRAVKKLGPLQPGEVFGFFPALAMGGAPTLDNLQRISASEHFSFLAQVDTPKLMNFSDWPATVIREIG